MNELTELLRERHETWAHGHAVLRMSRASLDDFFASRPPAPTPRPWEPQTAWLTGIPVVVDDSVPAGRWRLNTPGTDDVLREGSLLDTPTEGQRP